MACAFELPDVGEGLTEAVVLEWLVEEGEQVSEDQPIVEVETDKAVVEVPSPVDGTVRERLAGEGDVVAVGEVFVTFEVADPSNAAEDESEATAPITADPSADDASTPAPDAGTDDDGDGDRVFAPPHVRRTARVEGIDLESVAGSGPGGRITEADVHAAVGAESPSAEDEDGTRSGRPLDGTSSDRSESTVRSDGTRSEPTTPVPSGGNHDGAREQTLAVPATRRVAREEDVDIDAVPAVEQREGEAFVTSAAVREFARDGVTTDRPETSERPASGTRHEPYSGLRKTIGDRMVKSKFTAPHVTHFDEAVVTDLVETRSSLESRVSEQDVSLTYLPFVLAAVSRAVQEQPRLNATLDEANEEIVYHDACHVGVATDTDDGLLVPVIEDVDEKGLLELAETIEERVAGARERSLPPNALSGSTVTVTNFGAIGGEFGTPIVNPGEAAILGLGRIEQRPVVVDGDVVARPTLPLSLSFDHRIVDGADAARFTNAVIEYLESPERLLL